MASWNCESVEESVDADWLPWARQTPTGQDAVGATLLTDSLPVTMSGAVLDLGAGDGRVGIAAGARGCSPIILVEVDSRRADKAKRNLWRSGCRGIVLCENYFDSEPFESLEIGTVVSNPPQLPTLSQAVGVIDSGGRSGFDHFCRVIELAGASTAPGGHIYLHVLGFLPIWCTRAHSFSIESLLRASGYGEAEIIMSAQAPIRPNGATAFEIEHIVQTYGADAFLVNGEKCSPDQITIAVRAGRSASLYRRIVRARKMR